MNAPQRHAERRAAGQGELDHRAEVEGTPLDRDGLCPARLRFFRLAPAVCALAYLLSACPSIDPAPTQIDRVKVMNASPSWTEFELQILGHGFGPTSIDYDLSSGAGKATTELRLEIFDQANIGRITVPREQLAVLSPKEINARVSVGNPLPAGAYGIRLFAGNGTLPIAQLPIAFMVDRSVVDEPKPDAGVDVEPPGELDGGDRLEDGAEGVDAPMTIPDVGPVDLGPARDAMVRPDSGIGPFVADYAYRQKVNVTNTSIGLYPTGTTFRLAIPHHSMVLAGRSRADGSDLALYLDTTRLDHAWDDRLKVNTDQLVMIAKMPAQVPQGTPSFNLALYYGSPTAHVPATDAVFAFAERFAADLPATWATNNAWSRCNRARPLDTPTPAGMGKAYCVYDNQRQLTRHTLGSPNVAGLVATIPSNQIYEASFWISGQMVSQTNDLVYFAYGPNPGTNYQLSTVLPVNRYIEYAPNVATFTFTEVNNTRRTVPGWRLPGAAVQTWTRTRARFTLPAMAGTPSLQFRFLSTDNIANAATFVAVTDLTVRLSGEPEMGTTLGVVEAR